MWHLSGQFLIAMEELGEGKGDPPKHEAGATCYGGSNKVLCLRARSLLPSVKAHEAVVG